MIRLPMDVSNLSVLIVDVTLGRVMSSIAHAPLRAVLKLKSASARSCADSVSVAVSTTPRKKSPCDAHLKDLPTIPRGCPVVSLMTYFLSCIRVSSNATSKSRYSGISKGILFSYVCMCGNCAIVV